MSVKGLEKIIRLESIIALCLLFFTVSCSDDEDIDIGFEENGVVAATGVSIVADIRNISEDNTIQWTTEIDPPNATNNTIVWSSDNPAVATVDQTGLIQAVGVGTAQITATLEDDTTIFDAVALTVNDGSFITTWNNTTEIIIPTNSALSYNYDVDWDNDGVFDDLGVTGNASKSDFTTSGPHTVRIKGQFPAIQFARTLIGFVGILPFNTNIVDKIVAVNQWGKIEWESMFGAFAFCENLEFSAADVPDLSRVTNMSSMFCDTDNANPNVSQWDVSNVTDMSGMFRSAVVANPDVSQWDVSNVTDMSSMFFFADNADPNVSQWDVSNVTDMSGMFRSAVVANPDVSQWNVSNVTNMSSMFAFADNATPNVSHWDVSNVTSMSFMFFSVDNANPDVSRWDVSNVTNMREMFSSASVANPDVSQWDVSNVTDMSFMFSSAAAANPDVSQWDVSNVTSMRRMFSGPLFGGGFSASSLSPENYSAALVNFASQPTQDNIELGASAINFCDEQSVVDAKATLEARGWVIDDAGPTNCNTP